MKNTQVYMLRNLVDRNIIKGIIRFSKDCHNNTDLHNDLSYDKFRLYNLIISIEPELLNINIILSSILYPCVKNARIPIKVIFDKFGDDVGLIISAILISPEDGYDKIRYFNSLNSQIQNIYLSIIIDYVERSGYISFCDMDHLKKLVNSLSNASSKLLFDAKRELYFNATTHNCTYYEGRL
ncbi:MAG: hypothetical protein QM504_08025 [Pseudomonadota bacterium]